MYLENVTCIENLEDAVELSSDKLKAIVTLKFPVNCKYVYMFIHNKVSTVWQKIDRKKTRPN